MSTTIDQRVVEMRFDNKQFESGVSTTLSSINKLKESLKFKDASAGLEDLSTAARRVDMSTLGGAVDKVGLKFSALYTIADQALRNITNSAMNAGKRIVSALTIDPIKTGFQEYETQINAIQTILANTESKGTTLDDVNSALDELNTYADKTIYNFTEMTRNIGTFTAAGVDLDTSVSAIKGIANLAAVSGSTSQQASTAMYQLSQALASGTVKLMDWNSVVNAGMGGQVFQDALKETARVHGIAIDDLIEKEGSFRETLKHEWLTSEILTETLSKFTGDLTESQLKGMGYTEAQIESIMKLGQTANDAATKVKTFTQLYDTLKEAAQSGWTQTWELLVGDFEESKELLTKISDVVGGFINKTSEARNRMIGMWKSLGGRDDLLESFMNIFKAIVSVVTPIKDAFREIFPPVTVEQLVKMTASFKEFTSKLILGDKASNNLKRTFKGIFAVIKAVGTIFGAAIKAVASLFGVVGDLGGGILWLTGGLGDILTKIANVISSTNIFSRVFQGVAKVIKSVAKIAKTFFNFLAGKFNFTFGLDSVSDKFKQITDSASDMKSGVAKTFESMGDAIKNSTLFKVLDSLWKGIKTIGKAIFDSVKGIFGAIVDKAAAGDITGLLDIVNGVIQGGLGIGLIGLIKNINELFRGKGGLLDSINGVLDSVSDCIGAFAERINPQDTVNIMDIAKALAVLTAAILLLSFVDEDKVSSSLAAVTAMIIELVSAIAIISKLSSGTSMKVKLSKAGLNIASAGNTIGEMARALIPIAGAVLMLSAALVVIGKLDPSEVKRGLIGVTALMLLIPGVMVLFRLIAKIYNKTEKQNDRVNSAMTSMIKQLLPIVAAVAVLSWILKSLGKLSMADLSKGMLGVSVLMLLLPGVFALLRLTAQIGNKILKTKTNTTDVMQTMVKQLLPIVAAVAVLALVLKSLAKLSWEELLIGITGMATAMVVLLGALAIIALITKIANPGAMNASAASLVIISVALSSLVPALLAFTIIKWESIAKAGVVLAGLVGVVALIALIGKILNVGLIVAGASALIVVGMALSSLVPALTAFMLIKWNAIAKAGVALMGLVGVMALIALIGKILNAGLIVAGASALIIMGMALSSLVPALLTFAIIKWETIIKAAVGLLTLVTALKGVSLIAQTIKPGPLAAAAASVLIVAIALSSLVPALLGLGLVNWSSIGKAAVVLAGLVIALKGISLAAIGLEPLSLIAASAALVILAIALRTLTPTLVVLGALSWGSILKGLVTLAATLAILGLAGYLLGPTIAVLSLFATNIALLGVGVLALSLGVTMLAVALKVVGVGLAALGVGLVAFLAGLAAGIVAFLSVLIVGILNMFPEIVQVIDKLIQAVLQLIIINAPLIAEAILALCLAVVSILTESVPVLVEGIVVLLVKVLQILANYIGPIIDALAGIIIECLDGLIKYVPIFVEKLVQLFMLTFASIIDALMGLDTTVLTNAILGIGMITVLILACSALSSIIPAAMFGLLGLAAFIIELGIVLAALGALAQIPGLKWLIDEGGDFLQSVGTAIGKFVGSIIGNIAEGVTSTLPKVATNLSNFMKNIQPFIDGAKLIDASVMEGVNSLANVILKLTAANILDGLTRWITGGNSITKFALQLPIFGAGLAGFGLAVSGVDPESIKDAASAAESLAEMTRHIPNEGGMVAWFTGENSITKFAGRLPALGLGLAGFGLAVSGIKPDAIKAAADAALNLAKMTSHIPNEGGVVSWFTGENSISKFAGELLNLGIGLAAFALATSGITPDSVKAASEAALSLADMTNHIPNDKGVLGWLVGNNSIARFASELAALGIGLAAFALATIGIKPDSIKATSEAAANLADMTSHIPNEGGIKAWFSGSNSVVKFAARLPALGIGLAGFALAVCGVKADKVTAAAGAAESLADMTTHIPKESGIKAWFGNSGISKFAKNLPTLGAGLKGFSDSVSDVAPVEITAAATAAISIAEFLNTAPSDAANKASEYKKALETLGSVSVEAFVNSFDVAIQDAGDKLTKLGEVMVTQFSKGITSNSSKVTDALKKVVTKAAKGAKSQRQAFYDCGVYICKGLKNGISSQSSSITDKVTAVVKAALAAAKKALGIKSPSREFYKIGDFAGQGFVNALGDYTNISYKAGSEMAKSARDGLRYAMSKVVDAIDGDISTQPTIRPVLDLSDVRSGASAISSLLGGGASVGVLAKVGSINSMVNRQIQNGANDSVVSAIEALRKEFKDSDRATYNINGITYDDGSNIVEAVQTLIRAARIERRV